MTDKNIIESEVWMRQLRERTLSDVRWVDVHMAEADEGGVVITEIRIQGKAHTGGDVRCIVKAVDEQGRRMVAFVNGNTPGEVLTNLRQKAQEVGITWREDKPWEPK